MSLALRFFLSIVPEAWAKVMEAESKGWRFHFCAQCRRWTWQQMRKDPELAEQ